MENRSDIPTPCEPARLGRQIGRIGHGFPRPHPYLGRFRKPAVCGGGFSLVEVTVALGIVAYAFVAMLGLIPSGLNTFHLAMDASVTSQIFQRVTNEVQQADFGTLVATEYPDIAYFDDQGNKLDSSGKAKAIYQVKTRVQTGTTLPGGGVQNPDIATVTIQVANNPGNSDLNAKILDTDTSSPLYNLWKSNMGVMVVTQTAMVARNTSLK